MNINLCQVLHAGVNFLPHFFQKLLGPYFTGEAGSRGSVVKGLHLGYAMKRPNCWLTSLLIPEAKPLQQIFKTGVFIRDVCYYLVFCVFGFWH